MYVYMHIHTAIRLRKMGEAQSLPLDTLLSTLNDAITKNLELNQITNFVIKPKEVKEVSPPTA